MFRIFISSKSSEGQVADKGQKGEFRIIDDSAKSSSLPRENKASKLRKENSEKGQKDRKEKNNSTMEQFENSIRRGTQKIRASIRRGKKKKILQEKVEQETPYYVESVAQNLDQGVLSATGEQENDDVLEESQQLTQVQERATIAIDSNDSDSGIDSPKKNGSKGKLESSGLTMKTELQPEVGYAERSDSSLSLLSDELALELENVMSQVDLLETRINSMSSFAESAGNTKKEGVIQPIQGESLVFNDYFPTRNSELLKLPVSNRNKGPERRASSKKHRRNGITALEEDSEFSEIESQKGQFRPVEEGLSLIAQVRKCKSLSDLEIAGLDRELDSRVDFLFRSSSEPSINIKNDISLLLFEQIEEELKIIQLELDEFESRIKSLSKGSINPIFAEENDAMQSDNEDKLSKEKLEMLQVKQKLQTSNISSSSIESLNSILSAIESEENFLQLTQKQDSQTRPIANDLDDNSDDSGTGSPKKKGSEKELEIKHQIDLELEEKVVEEALEVTEPKVKPQVQKDQTQLKQILLNKTVQEPISANEAPIKKQLNGNATLVICCLAACCFITAAVMASITLCLIGAALITSALIITCSPSSELTSTKLSHLADYKAKQ